MSFITQARKMRPVIEQAAQYLDDSTALTAVALYPAWVPGRAYSADVRVRYGESLRRCVQAHTSQTGWEPENAVSLWEQINETHTGELSDPVPYAGNMALTSGLYYIQDGVIYLCTRDTVNPVYNALKDLVGLYVEIAA